MKAHIKQVTWQEARKEVMRANPELAGLIDNIDPGSEYTLYKACYPYGYESVQNGCFCWPDKDGNPFPLADSDVSNKIKEDLLYNLGSNPVTLVLKNALEIFMEMETHTIPFAIVPAGGTISTGVILDPDSEMNVQPAFLWKISAGARSLFMLRKISIAKKYNKIKEITNIKIDSPKNLFEHGKVFHALGLGSNWCVEVLYFGKKWTDYVKDKNPKWINYYNYLYKQSWRGSRFWHVEFIWNLIFSFVQKRSNLKPDPYLADTVKHLLAISIGVFPGFAPALDDSLAPIKYFQKIFTDVYQLDDYAPIIMQPAYFSMNKAEHPVYYFLQYPTTFCFSPKARKFAKNIKDLEDIKHILNKYLAEISAGELNLKETLIAKIPQAVKYDFFHSTGRVSLGIKSSKEMMEEDPVFSKIIKKFSGKQFPTASKIFMGSIRISKV
jgi:hypothetical protein